MVTIDKRGETLSFLKIKGPCLPSDIAKHINTSILIASAVLSELSSEGSVKISKLKFGSSPIYYLTGQEAKLETIFYPRLNAKDKKTYDLLHQKKLLKDKELEPITRVSLRNLGDFAIPLFVEFEGKKILFWKWYSISDEKIKELLDSYFKRIKPKVSPKEKTKAIKKKIGEKELQPGETVTAGEGKGFKQEVLKEVKRAVNMGKKVKIPRTKRRVPVDTDFLNKVINFFNESNFNVLNKEPKTKREIDFDIMMPTPVGKVKYFCKAWNKKRINDADLSKVAVQSQSKKLPCVLLINGSLTKKAKLMIGKEISNLIVKKI